MIRRHPYDQAYGGMAGGWCDCGPAVTLTPVFPGPRPLWPRKRHKPMAPADAPMQRKTTAEPPRGPKPSPGQQRRPRRRHERPRRVPPPAVRPQPHPARQLPDPSTMQRRGGMAGHHPQLVANPTPPIRKLTPQEFSQVVDLINKTSIPSKAKCVLANWLGGVPESTFAKFSQSVRNTWNDTEWWQYIPAGLRGPAKGLSQAANAAGFAAQMAANGGVYTLEDACPGGPSVNEALALLMSPIGGDPQLVIKVVRLATGHRANLARQAVKSVEKERRMRVNQALTYAYDAATNTLKKMWPGGIPLGDGGLGIGVAAGVLLAVGAYAFLRLKP